MVGSTPGEPLPVAETLRRRWPKWSVIRPCSLRFTARTVSGSPQQQAGRAPRHNERATTKLTRDGHVIAAVEYDPRCGSLQTSSSSLRRWPDWRSTTYVSPLDIAQLEEMRNSGAAPFAAADRARHRLAATIEARRPGSRSWPSGQPRADNVELQQALATSRSKCGRSPRCTSRVGAQACLRLSIKPPVPSRRYSLRSS